MGTWLSFVKVPGGGLRAGGRRGYNRQASPRMSKSPARDLSARPRIQNLRLSFWGVQGSCPLFPETYEVEEYKRLVALDALTRAFADLAAKSNNGSVDLRKVLGGPPT